MDYTFGWMLGFFILGAEIKEKEKTLPKDGTTINRQPTKGVYSTEP